MSVRVLVDFGSPASYLAIAPACELEIRLGQAFEWLPYKGAPLPLARPDEPDTDRGTRHRRVRGQYLLADLRRYAEARGLDLGDIRRAIETEPAMLALSWLNRRAPDLARGFVVRAFDRIWREHAHADGNFVVSLLGAHAKGFEEYCRTEAPQDLQRVRTDAEAIGAWTSPVFVVGDEPFIGRQHLPIVEWLVTGQQGPPPI
ncbi:MAG TPA: DsbA family protein [Candidatus Binatia bacterium]|nr:DsbA family protein [Candidatus Binatia bacterium]